MKSGLYRETIYFMIVCIVLHGFCCHVIAQTGIGGVINRYAGVVAINDSTVTLSSVEAAEAMFGSATLPDTVMLIQMTGISESGNDVNNAGRHGFYIVRRVRGANITLKSPVAAGSYDPAVEIVQMVRVPSLKNARITAPLTSQPFDPATGAGGVLALMVEETLYIDNDIDVSGRGFRGGEKSGIYTGVSSFEPPYNHPNYPATASNRAGNKGGGAVTARYYNPAASSDSIRGYAPTWNGGGGGNGKWSGGGGGANGGYGGRGDDQSLTVNLIPVPGSPASPGGNFGNPIKYTAEPNFWSEHIFMGGGGGAGTGEGTSGGNGGGIILLIAGKLQFANGAKIKANGASVSGTLTQAGAGGGGAGGSILIAAADYGDFAAEIQGGNGGNVDRGACSDDNRSRGAGGGGSGGFLMISGNEIWSDDLQRIPRNGGAAGINGLNDISCIVSATNGEPGAPTTAGFKPQLKGFLRNYIFTPDTVCYGAQATIRASQPEGVAADTPFRWQFSEDNGNQWQTITAANTFSLLHITSVFTQKTLVRRIIDVEIADTSTIATVPTHQPIRNLIAPADTTLCYTPAGYTIRQEIAPIGGGGRPYVFAWETLTPATGGEGNPAWQSITGANPTLHIPLPNKDTTLALRRQITSRAGCNIHSNNAIIHIQPAIRGNSITPAAQNVCENTATQLAGGNLAGGNGAYNSQWQINLSGDSWENISDALTYTPTVATAGYTDHFYRRTITSGVCTDTSANVLVHFDRQPEQPDIITENCTGQFALNYIFSADLSTAPASTGVGTWWTRTGAPPVIEAPNQPATTVSNLQLGLNTIIWTVANGVCTSLSDSVQIEVRDITIPGGFSPNGDGINDCFHIAGAENASSSELTVRDRYNRTVYESSSYRGNASIDDCTGWWDGRNPSGKELPAGVYFYQFTLNGEKTYRGYVVLKR